MCDVFNWHRRIRNVFNWHRRIRDVFNWHRRIRDVFNWHRRIRDVFKWHEAFGLRSFARKFSLLKKFYEPKPLKKNLNIFQVNIKVSCLFTV
jgi:hypothetical protein